MKNSLLVLGLATCALVAWRFPGSRSSDAPAAAARPASHEQDAQRGSATPLYNDERPTSGVEFRTAYDKIGLNILESSGHGAGLCDFNEDGNLDLVLLGRDQVALYSGDGKFRFTDVTPKAGLKQKGHWLGVATGDFDGDGRTDLYLSGYDCSALYRNQGGFKFRDVTAAAGLSVRPPATGEAPEWRSSAAFLDADQDGRLDLYVARYVEFGPNTPQLCDRYGIKIACYPMMYKGQKAVLYRNLGNGRFADETALRGVDAAAGHGFGVACADYDGDGWTDIAGANDEQPGDLFRNLGRGRFKQCGPESGTAFNENGRTHAGMGIDAADYDRDGAMDLFVTTFQSEDKTLYRNLGNGVFEDTTCRNGLSRSLLPWISWGCRFLDYDNDTWPDLLVASGHLQDQAERIDINSVYPQPLILMRNNGGRVFTDVSAGGGPVFQKRWVARALSSGDIDNDGGIDAVVTNAAGHPLLLRNTGPKRGHWLTVRLEQPGPNRQAIGARIIVRTRDGKQTRDVSTAGSYLAANDVRAHFGLGTDTRVESITVRWPDGTSQRFGPVPGDQQITLRRGSREPISSGSSAEAPGRAGTAPEAARRS